MRCKIKPGDAEEGLVPGLSKNDHLPLTDTGNSLGCCSLPEGKGDAQAARCSPVSWQYHRGQINRNQLDLKNHAEASNASGREPVVQCSVAAVLDSFEVDNFGRLVSVLHQLVFSLTWDVLGVELSADAALCVNLSPMMNPLFCGEIHNIAQ
ncbi:unnamed protein product [Arctogadus glacialis]